MSERKEYIDIMKGIGIFLVIVGHTGYSFQNWIYSFHMGLFFWISGYLMAGKKMPDLKTYFIRKTITVIVPFCIFWAISVLIQYLLALKWGGVFDLKMNLKGLILGGKWLECTGNFPLWFLQLFFISILIFYFEIKYMPKWMMAIVSFGIMLGTLEFQKLLPGRPPFHINVLPCALVYLYSGFCSYKILEKIPGSKSIGIILLFIGWYLQMSYTGNVGQINSYWYYVESLCSITGLYILIKDCLLKRRLQVIKRAGELSLYIMGIHSLVSQYAGRFVQYFLEIIEVNSNFLQHMLVALTTFTLSLSITEGCLLLKKVLVSQYRAICNKC